MTTFHIPPDMERVREASGSQPIRTTQPISPVAAIRQLLSSLNMKQGDTLEAEVVKVRPNSTPPSQTTEPPNYRVELKVAQQTFTVLTDTAIKEHDIVKLLLKSDRQLQLLEVLPSKLTQMIQHATQGAIGNQRSLTPILANLIALREQSVGAWLKLPANRVTLPIAERLFTQLPKMLEQLQQTLPSKQQYLNQSQLLQLISRSAPPITQALHLDRGVQTLTAQSVAHHQQSTIQHMGQFLERTLHQMQTLLSQASANMAPSHMTPSHTDIEKDLKGQLLRMQQLFQSLSAHLKEPVPNDTRTQRLQGVYSLLLYQSRFTTPQSAEQQQSVQSPSTKPYPQPPPPLPGLPFFVKQPSAFSSLLTPSQTASPQNAIDQLVLQLKGGLNRLLLTQLNNLQNWPTNNDGAPRTFSFELPMQDQQQLHTAQVQLERRDIPQLQEDENGTSSKAIKVEVWNVTLNFDIEPLGPLYLKLSLQMPPGYREQPESIQEKPVKAIAQIWAERASTATFTDQYTTLLKEMLTAIGLEVQQIKCQQGTLPESKNNLEHRLVDLKT